MFGTIRKHQSWLWFFIIGIMVISMVTWTNQLGKSGNRERAAGNFGTIDGKAITADEFTAARNEAILGYFMQTQQWPDSPEARGNFDADREAYQRLFLIRRLNEYNIRPDADAVAQFAGLILRRFSGAQGQPGTLSEFETEVLAPHRLTTADFQGFLEHDLGIQQLMAVVGSGGKLITPQEIQALYIQNYQELAVDAVFFSASNSLTKVPEPSPQELSQFYTNQQAAYREPDMLQVSYVFFNVTNYLAQSEKQVGTTNLNEMAQETMTRLGTNGLRYGKTPEEALAKVRDILLRDVALSNALASAAVFEKELASREPLKAENLAAVAKDKGMEVKVTKPFEKEYGPAEIDIAQTYPVDTLFNLTPEDPFVDTPVRGADGVYIIAYNNRIPSRIPPLEEIRSRVIADYKFAQAMHLTQINGHVFAQTATNQLAQGKSFSDIAAQAHLTPVTVAPFSLSSERLPEIEDRADVPTFKQVAFATRVGSSSSFIPTRDGGFVVYVRKQLPIDQAKMKEQLPEFSNLVRQRRQNEAFEIWFQREITEGLRDATLLERKQQQGPS